MISDLVAGMKKDREAVIQLDELLTRLKSLKLAATKPLSKPSKPVPSTMITRILLSANGDINFSF